MISMKSSYLLGLVFPILVIIKLILLFNLSFLGHGFVFCFINISNLNVLLLSINKATLFVKYDYHYVYLFFNRMIAKKLHVH